MKAFKFKNEPKVLDSIKDYLNDIGTIQCTEKQFEELFCGFVKEDYGRLDYLRALDPDTLYELAEWLSEQDI